MAHFSETQCDEIADKNSAREIVEFAFTTPIRQRSKSKTAAIRHKQMEKRFNDIHADTAG